MEMTCDFHQVAIIVNTMEQTRIITQHRTTAVLLAAANGRNVSRLQYLESRNLY